MILFAYEGKERTRQTIMRSLEAKPGLRGSRARGFSLIEMTIVVALTIVVSVISLIKLPSLLSAQHLTNAYNTTLSAMRQARDNAVSQRTSYSVTLATTTTPVTNTITVAPTLAGGFTNQQNSVIYQLPSDVGFAVVTGVSSVTPTPDGYGSAANAIDFGYTSNGNTGGSTRSVIYFCPDGSAQTTSVCAGGGNWDGGVVYLNGPVTWSGSTPSGYAANSRAISLWGATGRLHGWRLYPQGAGYQWIRQ
jgi:type II secretory pathway pseudopilin PulG